MNVQTVKPAIDADALLAGAQFSDAFSLVVADPALDARQAAERMLGRSPRWIRALLRLRDAIVAPFGVTTSRAARQAPGDRIGLFPVLSETPQRLIAGFDDSHLDFRVVVDVAAVELAAARPGRRVTATTIVLTHNRVGRVYLAAILPFHRLVTRAMLAQVAASKPRQSG